MQPEHPAAEPASPQPAPRRGASDEGFSLYRESRPPSLLRRFFATYRHLQALLLGGASAHLARLPAVERRRPRRLLARGLLALPALFVNRELRRQPFPVQLRRRLELLGPTYIKLGQILSLRQDLLPAAVTHELENLFDRLPAVPYERFRELVSAELGRPAEEVFAHIQARPLGSASIGQIHLATTQAGERVILKVVKPGIRETIERDTRLLRLLGALLQLFLSRYQPRRILREFCAFTLRETDLRLEADNAETFAANFRDQPDVVFPRIYRDYSTRSLLCMELIDGIKPTDPRAQGLALEDRERLVDLGAEAIIRMLYRDGCFHADLHPGNLLILPGPRCGFIDLGMVGRFDDDLKRSLLYYYYCLATGDAANAARYLAALAEPGPGADPKSFRRDVEDVCRRWSRSASFQGFSLGRLILESVAKGGRYRMYFPVEMVLMVKAIVTFEGVGHILLPGFDVAKVSRKHLHRVLLQRFAPLRLAQESLRGTPELVDSLVKVPMLITEGLRLLEQATKRPADNPFAGIRATLFGGSCMVAGAILLLGGGPWPVGVLLLALGIAVALRKAR